jgi:hypothetical protein
MLENPRIRHYQDLSYALSSVYSMSGDNVSGADNQQERPGIEQWIVGFVDGEGCFSVPIFRNSTTRFGWQVQPEFSVVQGARSSHVLYELKEYFGCGRVSVNHRHDNHREHMYRWAVRSIVDLMNHIIPFFEKYSLRTAKVDEFKKFAAVVRLMSSGFHLESGGLAKIAAVAQTMNFKNPLVFWNPQRPYASHLEITDLEMKIWS